MTDPLRIHCEGSACPPCAVSWDGNVMCAMCGVWHPADVNGRLVLHDRNDILAMIARGDFD